MTYSTDFRRKVLEVREEENLTIAEVAERFKIAVASVVRWSKVLEANRTRRREPTIDMEALKRDVELYPDAYHYERAMRFGITESGIRSALKRLGISYKKKTLQHPKANEEARQVFQARLTVYEHAEKPIVFIDESGFAHDMPRRRGYAPIGKRCFGTQDWNARRRTNVIGALLGCCLLTVTLFTGSINADVFVAWITQDLLPKLPKNSVIVMDNASFHKRAYIHNAILEAGHILEYLPPYSPDLNPIEHKWAQAKALRKRLLCSIDQLFSNYSL